MSAELFRLMQIESLMPGSGRTSDIPIGVIDGPVDVAHPDLESATIRQVPSKGAAACRVPGSPACVHGTFVAGLLAARRESAADSMALSSPLLYRPIFCEASDLTQCPSVSSSELASALYDTVDAGARVINLSVGMDDSSVTSHPALDDAFEYAYRRGTLVVAASGNYGTVGGIPLFSHRWIIPVAACNGKGALRGGSNIGASLGRRGLLAPGENVKSLAPDAKYTTMSGTSVAAPFVAGTAVLLWAAFPRATAEQVHRALLQPAHSRSSVVPPLVNGEKSRQALLS